MDNYEVLGVKKGASKEDIKSAYEKRIKIIDREVENKKKADLFKGVLKNAYDELVPMKEEVLDNSGQVPQETIIMSVDEINKLINENSEGQEDNFYEDDEDYYDDEYEDDDYDYDYDDEDDYDDYYYEEEDNRKQNNKKQSNNKKVKSKKKKKNKSDNRKDNDSDDRKKHKKYKEEEYEKKESSLWLLPIRILVFPFSVILSIIVFILDIISAIIWVVTKVLIILSIVVISIHGYQVYSGSEMLRYDVLAGCGAAFVVGICLPLITKVICDPLKSLNSSLRNFVFHG